MAAFVRRVRFASPFVVVLGCGGKPAEPPALPVAPVATVVPAEPESDEPEVEAVEPEPEPEPEPVEPVDAGPPARTERPPMPGPCDLRPGEFSKVPCNPPAPQPFAIAGNIQEARDSVRSVILSIGVKDASKLRRNDEVKLAAEGARPQWTGRVIVVRTTSLDVRVEDLSVLRSGPIVLHGKR